MMVISSVLLSKTASGDWYCSAITWLALRLCIRVPFLYLSNTATAIVRTDALTTRQGTCPVDALETQGATLSSGARCVLWLEQRCPLTAEFSVGHPPKRLASVVVQIILCLRNKHRQERDEI